MKVKVKICGIRSKEAAEVAVESGADFIGLNFVPSSGRCIMQDEAKKIIDRVKGRIYIVGIFQNQDLDFVNSYIDKLKLDLIQLHGDEDQKYVSQIKTKIIIKAVKIAPDLGAEDIIRIMKEYPVEYFLLDRPNQGQGDLIDREKAKIIAEKFPIFLAGGLNPENVTSLVKHINPYGVDVAGGIETDGIEDAEKIKKFIERAKGEII